VGGGAHQAVGVSHVDLVQGSGFRVQGAGCRVQGAGSRVQGPGSRGDLAQEDRAIDAARRRHVPLRRHVFHVLFGPGFRVQGAGFRVQGSGFGVQGSGLRVEG